MADDTIKRATALKEQANKLFQEHRYQQAVDLYTQSVELDPNNAVVYSNRAFAQTRLENHGSAIQDATRAIELDPKYVKGYYRRGSAFLALGKYKEGLRDFKAVVKICPTSKEAQERLKECEKAVRRLAFEAAISMDHEKHSAFDSIDLENVPIEPSYEGIHMPWPLTPEFAKSLLEEFKNQKKLHKKYIYQLLIAMRKHLTALPNLTRVSLPIETPSGSASHITVVGDLHGQYYDLLNLFEINGLPSDTNPYLFNGDFVDRGSFSLEVILTLFVFALLYPKSVFLSRGNHESRNMNKIYGFEGEVVAKATNAAYEMFAELFCLLPLGAVIDNQVFVVHGGLFERDDVTLDDIDKRVDRNREPPSEGLMSDMLWSDPQPQLGRAPSKRGVGSSFGPDVTKAFLARNGLSLVIRSHEVKDEGYELAHDGKCVTVFSAPNYCDQMGNKAAVARLSLPDVSKPEYVTYSAVPHPKIPPMAYCQHHNVFGL